MRLVTLLTCATLLLAPGCLEDMADDGLGAGDDAAGPGSNLTAPADAVFTGSLQGVGYQQFADPGVVPACGVQDRQCVTHTVTVPAGTWKVTFTLHGDDGTATGAAAPADGVVSARTDYDLFVDGVGESTNPAGADDVVEATLEGGSYDAQVLAWNDVDGSYTLTAHFEAA